MSDELVWALAMGDRIDEAPYLVKGTRRIAKYRRLGVLRRLEGCCQGLPAAMPAGFDRPVSPGLVRIALADFEALEWRTFLFQILDGVSLPVASPGKPLLSGFASQARALLGASQNWLERNRCHLYREPARDALTDAEQGRHPGHGIRVVYSIEEMFTNPGPRLLLKFQGVCWNHSTGPFELLLGASAPGERRTRRLDEKDKAR